MVLTGILVVYDKCPGCGARDCLVASFPHTVYSISTLERMTRKTCSQCRCEVQIKRIKARVNTGDAS